MIFLYMILYNYLYHRMTSSDSLPEKITQLQCFETNSYFQSQFLQWINESFKYKPKIL